MAGARLRLALCFHSLSAREEYCGEGLVVLLLLEGLVEKHGGKKHKICGDSHVSLQPKSAFEVVSCD